MALWDLLASYSKSRQTKLHEGMLSLNTWRWTALLFLAGIAWVVLMNSMDPYVIKISAWAPWTGPLQQGKFGIPYRSNNATADGASERAAARIPNNSTLEGFKNSPKLGGKVDNEVKGVWKDHAIDGGQDVNQSWKDGVQISEEGSLEALNTNGTRIGSDGKLDDDNNLQEGIIKQGSVEDFNVTVAGESLQNNNYKGPKESNASRSGTVMDGEDAADDGYFIYQTGIRGRRAVESFRNHVACLSASGRWVYDATPRKLPWLAVKEYNWVGFCDKQHQRNRALPVRGIMGEAANNIAMSNGTAGNWSVREELKWMWRTNETSCPWHPMDRDDFCRRIRSNRNILVVGDSINHEISVALQNALAMNKSSAATKGQYPGEEMCSDVLGGVGKGIAVHFVRNDYLSLVANSTRFSRNFQDPWLQRLNESKIDILVLNRGAHYQADHQFVRGLRATFSFLQKNYPNLLVIYRNTPSGHVNCSEFHYPIAKPLGGTTTSFHWTDFDRQNLLAKSIVEEFHYIYVDVARAVGMRPEGHMNGHDCLHYCQPGPLDLVVEMIYNVFMLLS